MLNFFENINLKATRLLEGYYSLFCGLFVLCVGIYVLALVFRVEWLLLASSAFVYACFVLLAFRSLFWFVLSLIFSPAFAIVVRERYDENLFLDVVFALIWILCWLFLSLAVSENISKLGNEIVSKILRIAALFAVIGVYYVSIENSLNLQAILQDTVTLRIVLIAINIYMFPSLIALLALDLRGYYLKSKGEKRAEFSFFNLAREGLKALKFIALRRKV
nr:nitrogen fixation protein NifR [uncultured Campylobacter sp.]